MKDESASETRLLEAEKVIKSRTKRLTWTASVAGAPNLPVSWALA